VAGVDDVLAYLERNVAGSRVRDSVVHVQFGALRKVRPS
jgi:hypothetical protein